MNKEAIEVAHDIKTKIIELDKGLDAVKPAAEAWSRADAEYDKSLAITLIKLKNGIEMELGGEKIKNPPATTSKKIAEGIVSEQKYDKNIADTEYKRVVKKLDCVKAQLNGHQSINRHLASI